MKSSILSSILVLASAAFTSNLRASTLDLTLFTGTTADVLSSPANTEFDGVAAQQYSYLHTTECVVGIGGCASVLSSTTSLVTVTVADVSSILTLVNVNDVCTDLVIIGSAPPCQSFAFSATNVKLGDGELGVGSVVANVLGLADVNVGVGLATLNIDGVNDGPQLVGLGVQGANEESQFTRPPSAATPEPASLSLLATGLVSAAGMIRRRVNRRQG